MNIICKILVFSILAFNHLSSQNLMFRRWQGGDQYDVAATYPVTAFTSDFGPRNRDTDHYDWHGGLDYNDNGNDEHDLVIGVEYGTVVGDMRNSGIKHIKVLGAHNFNYVHLFHSGSINSTTYLTSGACELRIPNAPYNNNNYNWALIFSISGVVSAITNVVPQNNIDVTVTSPNYNNGLPIIAHNYIDANYPMVGPVGTSGGYPSHLHLGLTRNPNDDYYDDNLAKNPLQFVTHPSPIYINDILYKVIKRGEYR